MAGRWVTRVYEKRLVFFIFIFIFVFVLGSYDLDMNARSYGDRIQG